MLDPERGLFFAVHYGPLLIAGLWLWLSRPRSRLGVIAVAGLLIAVLLFLTSWGQWPLVGSYYLRFLSLLLALAVFIRAASLCRQTRRTFSHSIVSLAGSFAAVAATVLVCWGLVLIARGQQYPEPAAELQFPLRDGRYYIASGGATRLINGHMRAEVDGQRFALDINRLGPLAGAARNAWNGGNPSHHIFGQRVFAPCSGTVAQLHRGVKDNRGSSMNVSAEDGTGNQISIQCGEIRVTMSHLKYGSVTVALGEAVEVGQALGEVGNSGFSQEPHLHLQAAVEGADGHFEGVPMSFGGWAPVRNDLVVN